MTSERHRRRLRHIPTMMQLYISIFDMARNVQSMLNSGHMLYIVQRVINTWKYINHIETDVRQSKRL